LWTESRESNLLDGGAPFARCYETRDGKYVAVCALETAFFAALLDALCIDDIDPADQYDPQKWPAHREILAHAFRSRSRDAWDELLRGVDACATPVLTLREAAEDEHARARGTYVDIDGIRQPGPAPRFSRTVSEVRRAPADQRESALDTLRQWGLGEEEIQRVL
jgi:alpha-methylacyl-CoA racemase